MTDTGRVLPHNEEVEGALIARLLTDPEQVPVLAGTLPAEDIYTLQWRQAFEGMQRLSSSRQRIDLLTLQDALGDREGILSDRLAKIASYRAPIEEYAAIIRRDAFRRRLIAGMEKMAARAHVEEDRGQLISELSDTVVQISTGADDDRLVSPIQAADAYMESLALRRGGEATGLSYGFHALDAILNPAGAGEMIVIAARPSVGKTALAESIAEHWAGIGTHPVLFVSLEMSLTKLLDRTVARQANIPARSVVRGQLKAEQYDLIERTVSARRGVRLWYLDDPFATTGAVRAAAARVRIIHGGLSGIIIDYLQLLKDGDRDQSEVQRVTRISRQIKAIAREFEVPLIVLSQLNRSVMSRPDAHPQLHDLRESGAIEQDADVVVGLYRPPGESLTDAEVLKQRQGEVGMAKLSFDADHVRFADVETALPFSMIPKNFAATVARPDPYWDTD